jgi:hypothetical protein
MIADKQYLQILPGIQNGHWMAGEEHADQAED